MSVNILVDALQLLSPKTGIGKYTYENCIRLRDLTSDDINWHYNYGYISDKLINADDKDHSDQYTMFLEIKSMLTKYPFVKSSARLIIKTMQRLSPKSYDLYWQPNFIPSHKIKAKKTITSVHDFSFLIHPDWHPVERRNYITKMIFKGIERSDHIITGSNFTKAEIMKYAGCNPDLISVIYHGVDHKMFKVYPQAELENFRIHFNLPDKFLLFVGSIEPRKNLLKLLHAYKSYIDTNPDAVPLILVGFQGWKNSEIMKMVNSLNEKVRYLGYLSDRELAYIYNLATIFIYPSLYEGFGIPPLEAMACGTPVITSSVSSIPEVCGEAVLYVNPQDESDLKQKIELLITQEDLRESLIQKGLNHCQKFTWENSAQKHWELFERVMKL